MQIGISASFLRPLWNFGVQSSLQCQKFISKAPFFPTSPTEVLAPQSVPLPQQREDLYLDIGNDVKFNKREQGKDCL